MEEIEPGPDVPKILHLAAKNIWKLQRVWHTILKKS